MLGMHFVATRRLSRESGRCFSLLFERRHSSDYDDFAYSSEEEIDELLPKAQSFIKAVGDLVKEQETIFMLYLRFIPISSDLSGSSKTSIIDFFSKYCLNTNPIVRFFQFRFCVILQLYVAASFPLTIYEVTAVPDFE